MVLPQNKDQDKLFPPTPPLQLLQQAFSNLHSSCNGFFRGLQSSFHHNFSSFSLILNPNVPLLSSSLQFAFSNLHDQAAKAIETRFSSLVFPSAARSPTWARIASPVDVQIVPAAQQSGSVLSNDDIEERLSGVLVYALCNSMENFVLISGPGSKGSMSLFCFKEEDANSLLQQMRSTDPWMSIGTKVVAVPLNKVYRLKAEGVAFRFLPEASQIKNAMLEMQRAGYPKGSFSGVPVFQSQSLILKGQNKTYRPVFFRKEDLENLLQNAYVVQGSLSSVPKQVDIQIGAFEDIISAMKDTCSQWDDVVFIPPGFDIGSDPSRIQRATSF